MIFIFYTEFVSQLAFQATLRKIKVLEEFHYFVGPFLKVEITKPQLNDFLEDFGFMIEESKQIRKGP